MSRKKIIAALAVVLSLGFSACTPKADPVETKPTANVDVAPPAPAPAEEIVTTDAAPAGEKTTTEGVSADKKTTEKESKPEASQGSNTSDGSGLKIYTKDPATMKSSEVAEVKADETLPLEEKVKAVIAQLGSEVFKGKKLELKEIKDENGKKIAFIDLKGKDDWNQAFQGSTGGAITQTSLIDSLLQKEYKGEWIDGVKYTLDGADIISDHVPGLSDINFR